MNRSLIGFALALALTAPAVAQDEAPAPKADAAVRAAVAAERAAERAVLHEVTRAHRASTAESRAAAAAAYREALKAAEVEQRAALEAVESARRELEARASEEYQRAHEKDDARRLEEQEMREVRRELERAHENLRRASREVARVHRDIIRPAPVVAPGNVFAFASDDRAVIGVIVGSANDQGVKVLGVSPDGPAERAGMQQGDVIVSLMGEPMTVNGQGSSQLLLETLETIEPGDELDIGVDRNGERLDLVVVAEQREPFSWHSYSRITSTPSLPGAPGAPTVIERIEVPRIDREVLGQEMERLREELDQTHIIIRDQNALRFSNGQGDFEFEFEEFSDLGDGMLGETNVWFGMPLTRGLKMAELDGALGAYFNAERGVLILEAREDNQLELRAGDVILSVNGQDVSKPADVMRALRNVESGSEVELDIKREQRDRTLSVVMPEHQVGQLWDVYPDVGYAFRLAPHSDEEPAHEAHPAPEAD